MTVSVIIEKYHYIYDPAFLLSYYCITDMTQPLDTVTNMTQTMEREAWSTGIHCYQTNTLVSIISWPFSF